MIDKLIRGVLGLILLLAATLSVPPADADHASGAAGTGFPAVQVLETPSKAVSAVHSTSSPSPSGPVDPGTGESKEAKQARVDYAPYVIAGVIVVVLVASLLFWRRRRISHPKKPG
jgi:cobalamin biosynthesis Mg chelatase CobN